jgi:uncharacterized protein YbjT (DUF2867 family)
VRGVAAAPPAAGYGRRVPPPGRILVTGANGHLGRRLLRRLAATAPAEPAARAVVRSSRAAETLEALPSELRPEIALVDYADGRAMETAAQGCRAVVHLVGILKESSRSRYREAHEATCEVLARAAKAAGVERVVYLSILGASPEARNACLASKGRAERILLAGPVPAAVLRVPMVLGEGDFASRALAGQARARLLPLVRGGATWEQPIDAADVVEAIRAALLRGDPIRDCLDLAGPESLSHRELVQRAAKLLGLPGPRVLPVPFAAARALAGLLERLLRDPPITRAMLEVLEHDDRVDPAPTCARLGISLTPLDETLRRCLGEDTPK